MSGVFLISFLYGVFKLWFITGDEVLIYAVCWGKDSSPCSRGNCNFTVWLDAVYTVKFCQNAVPNDNLFHVVCWLDFQVWHWYRWYFCMYSIIHAVVTLVNILFKFQYYTPTYQVMGKNYLGNRKWRTYVGMEITLLHIENSNIVLLCMLEYCEHAIQNFWEGYLSKFHRFLFVLLLFHWEVPIWWCRGKFIDFQHVYSTVWNNLLEWSDGNDRNGESKTEKR